MENEASSTLVGHGTDLNGTVAMKVNQVPPGRIIRITQHSIVISRNDSARPVKQDVGAFEELRRGHR